MASGRTNADTRLRLKAARDTVQHLAKHLRDVEKRNLNLVMESNQLKRQLAWLQEHSDAAQNKIELDNLKRQLQWLKENYPKVKKEMAMKVGHEQFGPQQIGRVTRSQTRDARSPRRKGPVDYRPFFELQ